MTTSLVYRQDTFERSRLVEHVRGRFVERMDAEIQANRAKGDWAKWKPTLDELYEALERNVHQLTGAIIEKDKNKISEYAADLANVAMKAHETFGAKDE